MKTKFTLRGLNPYTTHHIFGISVGTAVGLAATAASAGMQLAGGAGGADAAQGAAGTQTQFSQLGIDELRNALGPSMDRLNQEQDWSDRYLNRQFNHAMGDTGRYANAGAAGLGRLNYLMGLDNGLGPQPTAPKAPKAPKYSKDPATAAAQKKAYQKALKAYDQSKTYYDQASATWKTQSDAQAKDPTFGSMMKPYDDRFEGQISDVAKRQYVDKYGQQIIDTAGEKYNDKYAQEILDTSRDTFDAADFQADPGYEFRRSEGDRGIEQSAAARGGLQSGAAQKELTRFNQDTASNEFDRAQGRWADQHNRHLAGVQGQQGFDYNAWNQNKTARLGALSGEQAFDYGVWDKQKGTELNTLINERDFDFGNFDSNRKFDYGALMGQVGIGQDAVNDQNQLREYFGGQRSQNHLDTAKTLGQWRNANAAAIAEFLAAQGNAQAAGQVGAANAWGKGFQGAGNALTSAAYYYGQNGNYTPGGRTPSGGRYAPEWYMNSTHNPA